MSASSVDFLTVGRGFLVVVVADVDAPPATVELSVVVVVGDVTAELVVAKLLLDGVDFVGVFVVLGEEDFFGVESPPPPPDIEPDAGKYVDCGRTFERSSFSCRVFSCNSRI